jgi:hypothetical protein
VVYRDVELSTQSARCTPVFCVGPAARHPGWDEEVDLVAALIESSCLRISGARLRSPRGRTVPSCAMDSASAACSRTQDASSAATVPERGRSRWSCTPRPNRPQSDCGGDPTTTPHRSLLRAPASLTAMLSTGFGATLWSGAPHKKVVAIASKKTTWVKSFRSFKLRLSWR